MWRNRLDFNSLLRIERQAYSCRVCCSDCLADSMPAVAGRSLSFLLTTLLSGTYVTQSALNVPETINKACHVCHQVELGACGGGVLAKFCLKMKQPGCCRN
jgi:hypothetical protein